MRPTPGERAVLEAVARRCGARAPQFAALAGGLDRRSWRLRAAGCDLVVRLGGAEGEAFGGDRGSEAVAQAAAARCGLAPELLWSDPHSGLLVARFVPGTVWSRGRARQAQTIRLIGRWLRSLHGIPLPAGLVHVDFAKRAEQLAAGLPSGTLPAGVLERAGVQRRRLGRPARRVLCHHDLHHLNIVGTRAGPVVLDWEYAGAGHPLLDLAGYAAYHDLDAAATRALLTGYAGRADADLETRLAAARWLFELVWLLWLESRRAARGGESVALAGVRRHLAIRLSALAGA